MADILTEIVTAVRRRLAGDPAPPDLEERARAEVERRRREGGHRSLWRALAGPEPAIIAEAKHASPSAGVLRDPFDPVALARAYQAGGAAALSVVTEPDFFRGDPAWIPAVRRATGLPVLRKDFIVEPRQLFESVLLGADAVLLIQRILAPLELRRLLDLAAELGLDVLLEIFADEDPEPAVASGALILGVNARDLATFTLDLDRTAALATEIPDDRLRVAESGIHTPDDLHRLHHAGYTAFLIGEHLVRAEDPEAAMRELLGQRTTN
ncbi:MAG TPA: indole-3-glycerol-phosphate synthase [Acidobacteria bacterium]|nr:indole-3-glycerol-phosphate synthase [Acidobacteriota bacterium]